MYDTKYLSMGVDLSGGGGRDLIMLAYLSSKKVKNVLAKTLSDKSCTFLSIFLRPRIKCDIVHFFASCYVRTDDARKIFWFRCSK